MDVATGYDGWSTTYDDSVLDAMDLALLERLSEPDWADLAGAADLGCGTGRTGAWLRGKGLSRVDGVDLSPGMLGLAGRRADHDRLVLADVCNSGLPEGKYDFRLAFGPGPRGHVSAAPTPRPRSAGEVGCPVRNAARSRRSPSRPGPVPASHTPPRRRPPLRARPVPR